MNYLELALIGGIASFVATGLGSLSFIFFQQTSLAHQLKTSIDFVLGVMLSAAAFSLIGPEIIQSNFHDQKSFMILASIGLGMFFVLLTQKLISTYQKRSQSQNNDISKYLLVLTLLIHNLPEGMGSGASVAGMSVQSALPIQIALFVQNIAEGFLIVLCLQSLGCSILKSVVGGLLSGVVEFSGATISGFFLQFSNTMAPFFLAAAGGAMVMSVFIEFKEAAIEGRKLSYQKMIMGLLIIPILNIGLGI